MQTKYYFVSPVMLLLAFLLPCFGQLSTLDRYFFENIKGIHVDVTDVNVLGMSAETLRTDVELKLRTAGIKVLSKEEWSHPDSITILSDHARLFVNVALLKVSNGGNATGYSFFVRVGLWQDVALYSKKNVDQGGQAETWVSGAHGIAPPDKVVEKIRSDTKEAVDKFINAYLACTKK